jgi:beta-mannosidase
MGEQHLYQIKISAVIQDKEINYPEFAYGAKTVELGQQRLNNEERLFAVIINGVRAYCRGGNWVPADSIYGRVTDNKYNKLIKEAREANFTMLRVWGGGLYERDCFYQYCDREGIMVWQDFMFACAAYPDHEQWFVDEVKREVEYQTKRLRNYASIVLWSGSNECAKRSLAALTGESSEGVLYLNMLFYLIRVTGKRFTVLLMTM